MSREEFAWVLVRLLGVLILIYAFFLILGVIEGLGSAISASEDSPRILANLNLVLGLVRTIFVAFVGLYLVTDGTFVHRILVRGGELEPSVEELLK